MTHTAELNRVENRSAVIRFAKANGEEGVALYGREYTTWLQQYVDTVHQGGVAEPQLGMPEMQDGDAV